MKRITVKYIIVTGISFLFFSCTKYNYKQLNDFVNKEENGLVKKRSVNGIDFVLRYRPAELLVLQEFGNKSGVSKDKINESLQNYKKRFYFLLSVSSGDKPVLQCIPNFNKYSEVMQQFGFGMNNNITLISSDKDTLAMVDFNFIRLFALGKSDDILFAFKRDSVIPEYYTFCMSEFGLRTGDIRFKFSGKDINKNYRITLKK
jgi:hypothetical protein